MFVRHPSGKGYLRLNTDHRASNNSSAAESLPGSKKNIVSSFLIASVDSSPDRWIDRENTWVSQQQLHGTFIKRDRFWNQPAWNIAILLPAKNHMGLKGRKAQNFSTQHIQWGPCITYMGVSRFEERGIIQKRKFSSTFALPWWSDIITSIPEHAKTMI